jgi:cytochrome c-type biogenesis protein CcmE
VQVNKRARNRLLGVTAIIVIVGLAILLGAGGTDGAYSRTVTQVVEDQELVGERVKVSGTVVEGSWDRKSNPMRFEIRDENETGGPTLDVVYNGGVPSTFGDGVVAIVTGELGADGTITTEDMITKCPSKYESATEALTVPSLLGMGDGVLGKPTQVTGYVVAGSLGPVGGEYRFKISAEGGGEELPVFWEGALPAGLSDGMQVVLGGELGDDGIYTATSVALSDTEK